ncbi:hypothetical protein AwErysi_09090 [Erysipelotrichaceae bacterium]|nr:hypothetical protein AwErysi_09090 [Erysipelotrichaceae bacterium]
MKIYIVVSQTRTLVGSVIRWYTKNEYNHVSIGLDETLEQCFSFARKNRWNPFFGGLVKEEFYDNPHYKKGKIIVFTCDVSAEDYNAIKNRVHRMHADAHFYKYSYAAITGILLKRPLSRENKYTCAQFVAELLESIDLEVSSKDLELTIPQDFMDYDKLQLVYTGPVHRYLVEQKN